MVDITLVSPNPPVPVAIPVPVKAPQPPPAPVPVGFPRHAGAEPHAETPPPAAGTGHHAEHRAPAAKPKVPAQPATYSRYGIQDASGMFFVQVMDAGSGRAVKTIPPAWILEVHARLRQAAGGAVDKEA